MQYKVLNDLQIKTTRRTIILKQGQIVELTSDNASKLVGKIEPVEAMPYITDFGSLVIPHNSSQNIIGGIVVKAFAIRYGRLVDAT